MYGANDIKTEKRLPSDLLSPMYGANSSPEKDKLNP